MNKAVEFKLNSGGVRELLQSAEMKSVCENAAKQVARTAGGDFVVSTYTGKTRVNASVSANSTRAYYENLHNNVLLKALGGVHI